jgi:hypothetical protein
VSLVYMIESHHFSGDALMPKYRRLTIPKPILFCRPKLLPGISLSSD